MPFIFIKTKVDSKIQTMQDQFGRKGQVISNTTSVFTWSSKKNYQNCLKLVEGVLNNQIHVNGLSIQRGFDSIDSHILLPTAYLERFVDKEKK